MKSIPKGLFAAIASFFLFILSFTAQAKSPQKSKYPSIAGTHEFSASFGALSLNKFVSRDLYKHDDYYYGVKRNGGALFLNYKYWFKDWANLGVSIGYQKYQEEFEYKHILSGSYQRNSSLFTAAIESKIVVRERGILQYYQILGVGYFHLDRNYNSPTPYDKEQSGYATFQYTPLGIRIGKTIGGFIELGIGYKGILNGGLFYKINPNSKGK
jgi:hypothetical protein